MERRQIVHGDREIAAGHRAEALPGIERAAVERLSLRILAALEVVRREVIQALADAPVGGSELLRLVESGCVLRVGLPGAAFAIDTSGLLHGRRPSRLIGSGKPCAAQKQNENVLFHSSRLGYREAVKKYEAVILR